MKKVHKSQFLNNPELWNLKEKVWKTFSQTRYSDDIIELKFDCHYLSKGILKPICLEIGQKALYYSKKNMHVGQLSLNFTTMTFKSYEGQILICLQKNSNILELLIDEMAKVKLLLTQKCIQNTFHEQYTLEKTIANGRKKGMVFQAKNKTTNERVAVKAYSKEYIIQFPHARRCLKNEIKALRMMKSEPIITLHEVRESDNSFYLIMDYIEGGSLLEKMINKVISEENLPILMYNFIKVLNQVHQKKIVLRNIAPDNILFRESQVDFLIINFGEVQFEGKNAEKPLVMTEFSAPEFLENKILTDKCDIYSIGVIFYKLIVLEENCQKNNKLKINLQAEQFIQAPKALQSIIKKMLRVDPQSRYSAEKCLNHRYFKKILNTSDIHSNFWRSPKNIILQQEHCSPISARLLESEKIESESSLNSDSCKSAQLISSKNNEDDKQQHAKSSKFSKFCSQMQEFYSPKNNKKGQDESLFKFALTNAYAKQEIQDKVLQSQRIGRKSGFIKKSNSLNV